MKGFAKAAIALTAIGLATLMSLGAATSVYASPNVRYVDDTPANNFGTKCPAATYTDIASALVGMSTGTIYICPGNYTGPVAISGASNLKLIGKGLVYLNAPDGFSGTAILDVQNSTRVVVRGLVVDGRGQFTGSHVYGIRYLNSSGTIQKNYVTRIRHTPMDGVSAAGIFVTDDNAGDGVSTVKILSNTVSDFSKSGILATWNVYFNIKRNKVQGAGLTTVVAQNGIEVQSSATGTIANNVVDGIAYNGTDWTASGILLMESTRVKITKNRITASQTGIALSSWCWDLQEASYNQISNNRIYGASWGISLDATDFVGYTACDPHTIGNRVKGNKLWTAVENGGDTGIFVGAFDDFSYPPGSTDTWLPLADHNTITGNSVMGYPYPIEVSTATNSTVKGNKVGVIPPGAVASMPQAAPAISPSR